MFWVKVSDKLPEQEGNHSIDDDKYFVQLPLVWVLYKDYRYGKDHRVYDKGRGWYWLSRREDIIAWRPIDEEKGIIFWI